MERGSEEELNSREKGQELERCKNKEFELLEQGEKKS